MGKHLISFLTKKTNELLSNNRYLLKLTCKLYDSPDNDICFLSFNSINVSQHFDAEILRGVDWYLVADIRIDFGEPSGKWAFRIHPHKIIYHTPTTNDCHDWFITCVSRESSVMVHWGICFSIQHFSFIVVFSLLAFTLLRTIICLDFWMVVLSKVWHLVHRTSLIDTHFSVARRRREQQ